MLTLDDLMRFSVVLRALRSAPRAPKGPQGILAAQLDPRVGPGRGREERAQDLHGARARGREPNGGKRSSVETCGLAKRGRLGL